MAKGPIDFWFTMGSTYSYLSVMRLADVERASGIAFRWRPFHLLLILQEMKHIPFADKPAKSRYMWRDIERRAAMHGLPAKLPAPYPAKQSCFRPERRRVANPICRQACSISDRIPLACGRSRVRPRRAKPYWPRPTLRGRWEFSARRPLPSATSFFGVTIV
jgi:hypothetical protein